MTSRWIIFFFSFLFNHFGFPSSSFGQRTTTPTWSRNNDITVRSLGMRSSSLNFNQYANKITSTSGTIHIRKEDQNAAIFEIEAPSEFEIEINVDYATYLARDVDSSKDQTIPMVLNLAYHNHNAVNEIIAKRESIDLPAGISNFRIPVDSRFSSTQSPSGSENGVNLERPKSVVYLFIFGTLGPISSVSAGVYNTQISINVNVVDEKN